MRSQAPMPVVDTLVRMRSQLGMLTHTCRLLEQRMSMVEDMDVQIESSLYQLIETERDIHALIQQKRIQSQHGADASAR
ncbi:hypothetical protein AB1Y20_018257 [Prymnesium parvum]|uniref:Uncharacterized protein n=1 Tax=Prymnesium parvum TaxID=97485 RepID=A0AB34JN34_PRYPA